MSDDPPDSGHLATNADTFIVGRPSPTDLAPVPTDPGALLQQTRGAHAARMALAHEMCEYLREGNPPRYAAELCGYTLDEVEAAMSVDVTMRRTMLRARAAAARELTARVKSGARGVSKMGLEILARTFDGWAPRTQQNLETQFAEALRELKARFRDAPPMPGNDALRIVLDVFAKHSQ